MDPGNVAIALALVYSCAQTPPSHEERGLVTIERFSLAQTPPLPLLHYSSHRTNGILLTWHNQEIVQWSPETPLLVRGWGLGTRLALVLKKAGCGLRMIVEGKMFFMRHGFTSGWQELSPYSVQLQNTARQRSTTYH